VTAFGCLRVVVCDDHELMRSALCAVLTPDEGLEVVGEAADGNAMLALVAAAEPDVVTLDLGLPGLDGLRCLELLRERHPDVATVVVSATDDPATIDAAFRRGAAAYALKSVNPLDLPATVRQAVEGSVFRPDRSAGGTLEPSRATGLSEKEAVVLAELAKGHSNREIARTLWLSEQTVKFHLRNVYRKLGVANRTDALRLALERDLVAAA
jgi:DNA-binding NarL/FixJ family response regulator